MIPLDKQVLAKLTQDPQLNFKKESGKYLTQGTCPGCGKAEIFIARAEPWVIACNRAKNCGYTEPTRDRYPELFENFTERYPVTEDDPDAPARAYLSIYRGFRATKVSGWYHKGIRTLFDEHRKRIGEVLTVRFPLWGEHYWERILDQKDVERNGGKKAHISYRCDFKGKGWTPPEQRIESGDWVFITEGIFQSIALAHLDPANLAWPLKVIASLSSSNLPRDIIQANQGKGIHWVLAYDHDPAGLKAMHKYLKELRDMGENVHVALGTTGRDWDDEWRAERLNQSYLDKALWDGAVAFSSKPNERAFWHHVRYPRQKRYRFAHKNALYRAQLSEKGEEVLSEYEDGALNLCWARADFDEDFNLADCLKTLCPYFEVRRIANCNPIFLYIQKDRFTGEQQYFFRVSFVSGNPDVKIALDGGALDSPAAFNKVLLRYTPGGTFDGDIQDLKYLRDLWFDRKSSEVQTLPFAGYDSTTEAYVFPTFGYYKGQRLLPTEQGYLLAGKSRIKTLQQVDMTLPKGELNWAPLYLTAFQLDGMALMSWCLGTLFAEQIRARYQSWTFFELTGEWGSGKSTMLEFMWRCMGMDQALRLEKSLLEHFDQHFKRLFESYKTHAPKLAERILKNHAQIAAWGACLPMLFGQDQISDDWVKRLEGFLLERAQDRQHRLDGDPPLLESFWDIYEGYNLPEQLTPSYSLEKEMLFNLSKNPQLIAIHLIEFRRICAEKKLPLLDIEALKKVLPFSKRYPFVDQRNVKHNGKAKHCWVFQNRDPKSSGGSANT